MSKELAIRQRPFSKARRSNLIPVSVLGKGKPTKLTERVPPYLQPVRSNLGKDWEQALLRSTAMRNALPILTREAAEQYLRDHTGTPTSFAKDTKLRRKDHIITLIGYKNVAADGKRHTNWFPWNRFHDVFRTIGYRVEWHSSADSIARGNERRIFVLWCDPTARELHARGLIRKTDVVFQKLTSIPASQPKANWTSNPKKWCKEWHWPLYADLEWLVDHGVNAFGFGCRTDIDSFPIKRRICSKLGKRIFWVAWGGTPFSWADILNAKPVELKQLSAKWAFVGSKWGVPGRGNVDAWEKYLTPLGVESTGGIGKKMLTDADMVRCLQKAKVCPIIHAPSWQAERGVQDRFYTVFLSGRFGICDNLGAVDMFGSRVKAICTEDPAEYVRRSHYYAEHIGEQKAYIEYVQDLIKRKHNFYVQWHTILSSELL